LSNAAHIDLDFKEPITLSALELICPKNTVSVGFRLETCQGDDCRPLPATTSIQDIHPDRAEFLAREFHRVGIRYLLLEDANLIAAPQLSLKELFANRGSFRSGVQVNPKTKCCSPRRSSQSPPSPADPARCSRPQNLAMIYLGGVIAIGDAAADLSR
jgi:hypothetical protein